MCLLYWSQLSLELLHQFTSDERLDGDLFVCSQCCDGPQSACKKLSVSQLPEVLQLSTVRVYADIVFLDFRY